MSRLSRRTADACVRGLPRGAAVRRRGAAAGALRRAQPRPDDEHARVGRRHRADPHRGSQDLSGQRPSQPHHGVGARRPAAAHGPRDRAARLARRLDRGHPGGAGLSQGHRAPRRPSSRATTEMRDSQEHATTAALRSLGIPVTTQVAVDDVAAGLAGRGQAARRRRDRLRSTARRSTGERRCAALITAHEAGRRRDVRRSSAPGSASRPRSPRSRRRRRRADDRRHHHARRRRTIRSRCGSVSRTSAARAPG